MTRLVLFLFQPQKKKISLCKTTVCTAERLISKFSNYIRNCRPKSRFRTVEQSQAEIARARSARRYSDGRLPYRKICAPHRFPSCFRESGRSPLRRRRPDGPRISISKFPADGSTVNSRIRGAIADCPEESGSPRTLAEEKAPT